MNAPENITQPINAAHEVLLKSDSALCVEDVARAIVGKKPTKADIKPVAKLLKELADLGLIEMEPRAGGVPFYRLIVASESVPKTLRATIEEHEANDAGEAQWLAPEDYEMPPADPVLLAMANKMLGERLEGVAHVLRGCGLPGLADATGAEDLQPKVAALAGAYQMAIAEQRERTDVLNCACSALERIAMRLGLHKLAPPDEMLDAIDAAMTESARLRAENLALKTLNEAMPGFGAKHQEQRIDSLTKDVINTRTALTNALNESDRLRGELAAERQAREALQEQDGVDVTDAAVGYLIRVTKRKPRYVTQPERARDAALAAVRAGAGRAEVLAVVPVGVARRGAEWRGSNPMGKGD